MCDTPSDLLVRAIRGLPPGLALDLACGTGQFSFVLADAGWQVEAVDANAEAIEAVRARAHPGVTAIHADLERGEFSIAPARYGLILSLRYYQASLLPAIPNGLTPGGIFVARFKATGRFAPEPGRFPAALSPLHLLYFDAGPQFIDIIARR